jgi:hypothetical protein
MNNIDRARMYHDINWSKEQLKLLSMSFNHLDNLLLLCERERNQSKINVLQQAHQTIHDLVLGSEIKDIINEIKPNNKLN